MNEFSNKPVDFNFLLNVPFLNSNPSGVFRNNDVQTIKLLSLMLDKAY